MREQIMAAGKVMGGHAIGQCCIKLWVETATRELGRRSKAELSSNATTQEKHQA